MTTHAAGEFDVTPTPLAPYETVDGVIYGRIALAKQFHGDLEASSTAEMLSAGSSVKGSAGYVAIERVTGRLNGRAGSFTLQHSGTMTRGQPELSVSVVPDSGAGELVGLAGRMTIDIVDGKHFYAFDYTLTPGP
jgi:hypothetical protein